MSIGTVNRPVEQSEGRFDTILLPLRNRTRNQMKPSLRLQLRTNQTAKEPGAAEILKCQWKTACALKHARWFQYQGVSSDFASAW